MFEQDLPYAKNIHTLSGFFIKKKPNPNHSKFPNLTFSIFNIPTNNCHPSPGNFRLSYPNKKEIFLSQLFSFYDNDRTKCDARRILHLTMKLPTLFLLSVYNTNRDKITMLLKYIVHLPCESLDSWTCHPQRV